MLLCVVVSIIAHNGTIISPNPGMLSLLLDSSQNSEVREERHGRDRREQKTNGQRLQKRHSQ